MPSSKVRAFSWRCRTPVGSSASIRGATPELSMMSSILVSAAGPVTG